MNMIKASRLKKKKKQHQQQQEQTIKKIIWNTSFHYLRGWCDAAA